MPTTASAQTPVTWTVTTTGDSTTAPACTVSTNCPTLRSAILAARSDDTIDLSGLTGTIEIAGALPTITVSMTITGPGANLLTISGGGTTQIFSIGSDAGSVTISGLTLENGSGSLGGAIHNNSDLNVEACTFLDNGALSGGAIEGTGTLTITGSTFYDNKASKYSGGAISSGGAVTIINSTFSGNSATASYGNGGAIDGGDTLTVTNSTFSGNSTSGAGGAIHAGSALTATNNIFSGNSAGTDGAIDFEGAGNPTESYNLFDGNSIAGTTTGSDSNFTLDSTDLSSSTSRKKANLNPMLLPLGHYGGPTETMMPTPGSAAICAGSAADVPSGVTTDQRGFPIAPSVGSCANGNVDIGSVQTNYLLVTSTSDSSSTEGSLPYYVSVAGGQNYADIGFSLGTNPSTIDFCPNGGCIGITALSFSQGDTVIIGSPGAVTISGGAGAGGNAQILGVSGSSTSVSLYGLTLQNGSASLGGAIHITNGATVAVTDSTFKGNAALFGGAIENGGRLTVTGSTFYDNKATQFSGGAIASGGTLTITGSTFYDNSARTEGGAIESDNTLTVTDSTFEGNQATSSAVISLGAGGAIYNSFGLAIVTNSTFSGNSATGDGGAIWSAGLLIVTDNIFANNQAGSSGGGIYNGVPYGFISSAVSDRGYNLFYENSGGDKANFSLNGDDLSSTTSPGKNLNPDLAPLGNYGGPTPTLLPRPDSAAICAGTANLASPLVLPTTDQRGFPRTTAGGSTTCIDIGSVETDYQVPTAELADYVNALYSEGVLNNGQDVSLLKKMDKAYEMAGEGKIHGAISIVNGFVSEVNGLYSAGVLTHEQASELLGYANVALQSFPSQ